MRRAPDPRGRMARVGEALDIGVGIVLQISDSLPEDPFGITKVVFGVTKIIYDQVRTVQANKEQFMTLAKRIATIENAIRGLGTIQGTEHYRSGLTAFQICVQECQLFVLEFQSRHWFKKVLCAGTYKEKFEEFGNKLRQVSDDLQLGLQAQQIMDREQDRKDQAADSADIRRREEEIKYLQQESMKEIQRLAMDEQERAKVLAAQLASIELRLKELTTKTTTKPEIAPRDIVPFYDLAIDGLLRSGTFARVYLGKWCAQQVAVKCLEGDIGPEARAQFIREVQIMSRLRSPYITLFQGACLEENRAMLIMEYMNEGSLYDALGEKIDKLKPYKKGSIAIDIVKGLIYLHSKGVIHRDLKSANVLLNSLCQAKITDFGLAKIKSCSIMTIHERSEALAYMAPELFVRGAGGYSTKTDIYSLGVILWELMTNTKVGTGLSDDEIRQRKARGEELCIIDGRIPQAYAEIIKKCLAIKVQERPELIEILGVLETNYSLLLGDKFYSKGERCEKLQDHRQARSFYEQAIAANCSRGYAALGIWSLLGTGGQVVDKRKAYDWFVKGATAGDAKAQYNLGQMLEFGDGVPQNLLEAYSWYKKASAQGHELATKRLQRIEEKIGEWARLNPTLSESQAWFSGVYQR